MRFVDVKCFLNGHKQGWWEAAVGGRQVLRCQRCDKLLEERKVDMQRVMDRAPSHRPTGRTSDTWPK